QLATALARRQPPCQAAAGATAPTSDRAGRGRQSLAGALQSAPLRALRCQRLSALRDATPVGDLPLRVGPASSRPPPCRGPWLRPGRGWPALHGGWSPLLLTAFTAKTEIVYLCIPDSDGENEGGQASSSLAISTRWISVAKFLQYDLATLVQRREENMRW
ncbi:hypothetical protein GW17_00060325, partial [Ensete ventricosum]